MTESRDLKAAHAWRGAFVAALLNVVGLPADHLLAHDVPNMPWYPAAMSAAVGLCLIALLFVRRHQATVRFASLVFLANTAAILVALWITSGYWAADGRPWTPFQANKLGALAVAMLAQELSVGLISIAGLTAMAIGKYYVLDPAIQARFPVGEPWVILFYALFAGVLLASHLRGAALERDTLRLHAEAAAAEQIARTFLRLRDYANTPIQTIVFATELIRLRHPDLKNLLTTVDHALEKLTKLSRVLTHYEEVHRWRRGDESPDAEGLAEQVIGSRDRRQHRRTG